MRLASMALLLVACVEAPPVDVPPGLGDLDHFRDEVQPVFAASCANPACHGQPGRPLELYAPQRHRLDPDRLYLDEELTEEEVRRNRQRSLGFVDLELPAQSLLLTEPLDPRAGGSHHAGGVQWGDALEPGYLAVLGWIESIEGVR